MKSRGDSLLTISVLESGVCTAASCVSEAKVRSVWSARYRRVGSINFFQVGTVMKASHHETPSAAARQRARRLKTRQKQPMGRTELFPT